MIDVAHDGDHRSAPDLVLGVFRLLHRLHGFGLVADGGGGGAEIARHLGGQLRIERLVDGDEDALVHQLLHHQRGLHVELLGELLHRDAFGNGDLAVDRRRSGFHLPAVLRTQDLLFVTAVALRSALAGTLSRAATTGSGRIGRRRRQTRLHAARTRHRMLRARPARTARGHARTHARPGHHRLAGTDRSAVDRLAGYRRRRRLRNTGARRCRGRRHGGPRRGELGRKIGTRWNHRTRCRLTGQGPLLLRSRRRTGYRRRLAQCLRRTRRRLRPRSGRRRSPWRRARWEGLARTTQYLSGPRRCRQRTRNWRRRPARGEHGGRRCGGGGMGRRAVGAAGAGAAGDGEVAAGGGACGGAGAARGPSGRVASNRRVNRAPRRDRRANRSSRRNRRPGRLFLAVRLFDGRGCRFRRRRRGGNRRRRWRVGLAVLLHVFRGLLALRARPSPAVSGASKPYSRFNFIATSSSIELECVFFSETPSSGSRSRIS